MQKPSVAPKNPHAAETPAVFGFRTGHRVPLKFSGPQFEVGVELFKPSVWVWVLLLLFLCLRPRSAISEESFSVHLSRSSRVGEKAKILISANFRTETARNGEGEEAHSMTDRGAEGLWETIEVDSKGNPVVFRVTLEHLALSRGKRRLQLLPSDHSVIVSDTNGSRTFGLADGSALEKHWPSEAIHAFRLLFGPNPPDPVFCHALEPRNSQPVGGKWPISSILAFTNNLPGEFRVDRGSLSGAASIALTNQGNTLSLHVPAGWS
jgi:hypothetical protein